MGQQLSIAKNNRRKSRKFFSSQIFTNGNNNLSHTFAIFDDEPVKDLVNINSSSENELSKVCGIDVELSRNIIKHRKAIGCYQKIEDLVVVPGMGAERLNKIKYYVCVSPRNAIRCSSQSFDSLKSVESRTTITKVRKLVNLNVATIYELQSVHGITQEIAAAIVCYRNKKGSFQRLEDLQKIKCIDCIRLDNISQYLTVRDEEDISEHESDEHSYSLTLNGNGRTNNCLNYPCRNATTSALLESTLPDIFELLSAYSPRPIVKEFFRYSRNDRPAFRISTWNLEGFSVQKASNMGVREVICRTILENGWSILAIQSVQDQGALKLICDELNEPELQRIKEWKSNSYRWKYNMVDNSELGYIYDTGEVNSIAVTMSKEVPSELTPGCDCSITQFKVRNTEIQVLNLIIKENDVHTLQGYLQKLVNAEANCLICCDFGNLLHSAEFVTSLENTRVLFPMNLSNSLHLTSSSSENQTSNFIVNGMLEKYLTGLQGIQRNGLTHLAIPSGWTWGGPVSSTCPVWVEFFVTPN